MSDEKSPDTQIINMLFLELSQFTTARTRRELDLKMLVVRLCRKLKNVKPDDPLPQQALDYLARSGMNHITDVLR